MSVSIKLTSIQQAHAALLDLWRDIKAGLMQNEKYVITVEPYNFHLMKKQRAYYHGYVLTTIHEHLLKYDKAVTLKSVKEHYRVKFLGVDGVDLKLIDGKPKAARASTEGLDWQHYSNLIDKVTADACIGLGVEFTQDIDSWVNVDMETGEIL